MSSAKYPGVTVLRPNKHHPRRARWVDPTTGRRKVQALPADEREAERWLLRKSAELMTRKALTEPPPGVAPISLELAIEKYLREKHRLRPATLIQYRYSLQKLAFWLEGKVVTLARLRAWRAHLDRPGAAAASVNRDLAHASAFLNHARSAGDVLITRDQIADGLKRLPSDHDRKAPFTCSEIQELVEILNTAPPEYRIFVRVVLLTGMRVSEALALVPQYVDHAQKRISLPRHVTKNKQPRTIDLSISPSCLTLLDGFTGWTLTKSQVRELREKLHPQFTLQRCRVTCGSYLTCAPGIYGGASAYMSAARLGHSVEIAQKHYVGVVRVPADAKTLEEALGIDK